MLGLWRGETATDPKKKTKVHRGGRREITKKGQLIRSRPWEKGEASQRNVWKKKGPEKKLGGGHSPPTKTGYKEGRREGGIKKLKCTTTTQKGRYTPGKNGRKKVCTEGALVKKCAED